MHTWLPTGLLTMAIFATACTPQYEWYDVVDQTYVHKYGMEVPQDYWTSAGREGAVVSTLANGIVRTNTFHEGILDGDTTFTFPHSDKLQRKEIYQNNQLEKEFTYYPDGSPKQETHYVLPLKYVTTWYTSGTPKSYETYDGDRLFKGEYYNLNNLRDAFVENFEGTRHIRDDYGQLLSTDTIRQGALVLSTNFHSNGTPKEMIPYEHGHIHGMKKTFYPGGEPLTIEEWKDGKQAGITTVFQNGEKIAEIYYLNGQKNGLERRYKDGKALVEEVSWMDGEMHGPARSYVGENIITNWYYQGEKTTKGNFDAMNSRLR